MANVTRTALCIAASILLWPLSPEAPWGANRAAAQGAPPEIIQTSRWRAWVDAMPGPGRRSHPLYVTGEIMLPTPGYKVTLVKARPADLRGPFLVLDLVIERERKPDAPVVTRYNPRYADPSPPRRYTGVRIRYRGKLVQTIERVDTIR